MIYFQLQSINCQLHSIPFKLWLQYIPSYHLDTKHDTQFKLHRGNIKRGALPSGWRRRGVLGVCGQHLGEGAVVGGGVGQSGAAQRRRIGTQAGVLAAEQGLPNRHSFPHCLMILYQCILPTRYSFPHCSMLLYLYQCTLATRHSFPQCLVMLYLCTRTLLTAYSSLPCPLVPTPFDDTVPVRPYTLARRILIPYCIPPRQLLS